MKDFSNPPKHNFAESFFCPGCPRSLISLGCQTLKHTKFSIIWHFCSFVILQLKLKGYPRSKVKAQRPSSKLYDGCIATRCLTVSRPEPSISIDLIPPHWRRIWHDTVHLHRDVVLCVPDKTALCLLDQIDIITPIHFCHYGMTQKYMRHSPHTTSTPQFPQFHRTAQSDIP